jgi:hypothetical protein
MDKVNSYLADWSIKFLENKDAIRKEIIKIEKNISGFDFVIHYKDKVKYFVVSPILGNDIVNKIKADGYFGIITLNNMANIKFVVSNWEKLAGFKFLNAYFVNPFSSPDKMWAINPYIHDKVCDRSSLELGLKSLAEMVAPLGVEELNNKIKLLKEESGL